MKRRHNIVVGTVLIIVIVLLFAHSQGDVLDAVQYGNSPERFRNDATSNTLPDSQSASPLASSVVSDVPLPATTPAHVGFEDVGILPSEPSSSDSSSELLQSEVEASSPDLLNNPPTFEAEFPFQKDLELALPISTLEQFSRHKAHNYNPDGPRTYAYATFMATRNPSLKDPYFLAIHSLIYRLLWSPRSRTARYPLVVFVADFVTPEQRALLAGAGALVRELSPLEWNPNVDGVQKRWKDLFAKLNMWNEIEFERILFLDADAFPLTKIDEMFDLVPMQPCKGERLQLDDFHADGTLVCETYIFAGVPQDPVNSPTSNINVGSMVFTPSERMHQRLLQNYVKTDRYDCLMAEQAFLNWQFNPDGAFPAMPLGREWGGFFPKEDEEGVLKVVHEKIWAAEGGWTRREWDDRWAEMLTFYGSQEFLESRQGDGAN